MLWNNMRKGLKSYWRSYGPFPTYLILWWQLSAVAALLRWACVFPPNKLHLPAQSARPYLPDPIPHSSFGSCSSVCCPAAAAPSRQWSPVCPALLEKGELVTTVWFILFHLCLSSSFLSWSPTLQENRQWWVCLRKLKRADVKPDSSGYCCERYQKEFWGSIDLEKVGHCQLPPWTQLGSRNSRTVCFALSLQEQVLDVFWETSSCN